MAVPALQPAKPARTPRRTWAVAFIGALAIGLAAPILAGAGIVLAGALVAAAASSRPRLAAVGGALTGFGAGLPVLILSADARCDPSTCTPPDLSPWFAASALSIAIGALLTAAAWRRGRPRS